MDNVTAARRRWSWRDFRSTSDAPNPGLDFDQTAGHRRCPPATTPGAPVAAVLADRTPPDSGEPDEMNGASSARSGGIQLADQAVDAASGHLAARRMSDDIWPRRTSWMVRLKRASSYSAAASFFFFPQPRPASGADDDDSCESIPLQVKRSARDSAVDFRSPQTPGDSLFKPLAADEAAASGRPVELLPSDLEPWLRR